MSNLLILKIRTKTIYISRNYIPKFYINRHMTLSNQNRAAHIKLFYYIISFLFLSLTVLTVYLNPNNMFLILLSLFVTFVVLVSLNLTREYNYIIYKETDDKIIMRYYPLHPFHDKFKSIEISKQTFSHFELEKLSLGLRENLYLFQMSKKGLAKYPAISLSALSKKQRSTVLESLSKFSKK